jgi:adenylate kinase
LVIFVGGIHGSGKTTFCRELAKRTGLSHRTVSEIIKEEIIDLQLDMTKRTSNLARNQRALIAWLDRNRNSKNLILDGHFALLDESQDIYCVDLDVFRAIAPIGVIYLNAPIDVALQRLETRDGKIWSAEVLKQLADAEAHWAKNVAKKLNIPICSATNDDIVLAGRFVHGLME